MAKWSNLAAFPVHSKTFNWIRFKVAADVHPTVHEFCNFVEKSRPVIWIFSHRQVVLTYDPSACDSKKVHTLTHWHTHTHAQCVRGWRVRGHRMRFLWFWTCLADDGNTRGRWRRRKRPVKPPGRWGGLVKIQMRAKSCTGTRWKRGKKLLSTKVCFCLMGLSTDRVFLPGPRLPFSKNINSSPCSWNWTIGQATSIT